MMNSGNFVIFTHVQTNNYLNLLALYLQDKAYEKGFLGPSGEASVSRVQKKGRLMLFNIATSVPNFYSSNL
jgi:hypothetical protein